MDNILNSMLSRIPDSYDKSEGSIFYDAIAPVAEEIVKLQVKANEILNAHLLDTATGEDLEDIARECGVERKAAQCAEGYVIFMGTPDTTISAGALVASEGAQYYVRVDSVIGADGTVTAPIVCAVPGAVGNVGIDCITRLPVTLAGVDSVNNTAPTAGGYDVETDEELRERTYIKIRTPSTSGNKYDYINWATEVEGVGGAKVTPLWNGPGTVKVVIIDSNGEIAGEKTVADVEANIEKKRPVGAHVTVVSASAKIVDVSAIIAFKNGYDAELVSDAIRKALIAYLQTFGLSGEVVSYAKIGAEILKVEGVEDYSDLLVNNGNVNVAIGTDEVPMMGEFIYVT